MQCGMFYMYGCEQSGKYENLEHPPTYQTAHTHTCRTYHTAYTAVSLKMNRRGSKHVGDNVNI